MAEHFVSLVDNANVANQPSVAIPFDHPVNKVPHNYTAFTTQKPELDLTTMTLSAPLENFASPEQP
jgi:hypothetical protein